MLHAYSYNTYYFMVTQSLLHIKYFHGNQLDFLYVWSMLLLAFSALSDSHETESKASALVIL